LTANAAELLDELLCTHVDYILEDRVNQRFGLLANKLTLTSTNDMQLVEDLRMKMKTQRRHRVMRQAGNGSLFHTFDVVSGQGAFYHSKPLTIILSQGRAGTLMLDYTLPTDPRVTPLGVELECSGEVSMHGRGGTPFGPMPFRLPDTVHEGSMVQMAVSDFVPNSLMYHGHT